MSIYRRLGVRPRLNAWGTVTVAGGSRMDPRVLEAMSEASRSFVDMRELLRAAERRIAGLLDVEATCITSGAAAGLAVATAACLAGTRRSQVLGLPDIERLRREVLVLKAHRILYDQAILLSGARFREIGVTSAVEAPQVRDAVDVGTVMFLYVAESAAVRGSLPLEQVVDTLSGTSVPVVVDAAAELPPRHNLTAFTDAGADLVVFSGGKELRGPQSSGIITGRPDLIEACRANAFPNHSIGRAMKVDKETVAGLVAAVELFVERDFDAEYRRWDAMVCEMVSTLEATGRCSVRRGFPVEAGVQPADIPRAYLRPDAISAAELLTRLAAGDPAVLASTSGDELVLNPQCLRDDELPAVLRAVVNALPERN